MILGSLAFGRKSLALAIGLGLLLLHVKERAIVLCS